MKSRVHWWAFNVARFTVGFGVMLGGGYLLDSLTSVTWIKFIGDLFFFAIAMALVGGGISSHEEYEEFLEEVRRIKKD